MLQATEATPNQFDDAEEVHIVVISADCVVSEFIIVSTLYTVHCISFEMEKFHSFCGLIGNHKNFPVKSPVQ